MGIPKFYRWLSERYPCLSEVLKEYQIPEFDNLYLDMNGIIHTCSHPDDSSIYIQVPESKIFADICHYIEVLFRMIKPGKVFFMAVDGVAPRAKQNQQRSRRFRSAKEAEMIMNKELRKAGELPEGTRFDSNCITPGTEFMTQLNSVMKEFVASKVKSDPMWQRPIIIFSGHEAPGEGEHKVMDFIRREKSRPDFNPNTKHCLYGLDADLIMLSLVTHEPHFALLREEVKFSKNEAQKRSVLPEDTTFHLLHISLLRDYLNLEFGSLENSLPFKYDLERIIDDWVLMGFLVGNDFIPNLPNLHIHHDCLPILWKTYVESLPSLGGYINEGGILNLERFEQYLSKLHQFDYDKFEDAYADMKWLWGKKGGRKTSGEVKGCRGQKNQNSIYGNILEKLRVADGNADEEEEDDDDYIYNSDEDETSDVDDDVELNGKIGDAAKQFALGSDVVGIPSATDFLEKSPTLASEESTDDSVFEKEKEHPRPSILCEEHMFEEFKRFKEEYYKEKMRYEVVDENVIQTLANEYVEAIQWILHYYYNGIQSWSWFYPHHYAPFLSDIRNFSKIKLTFDMGRPFLPFQQLMAVLPKASKQLLPSAFQKLMEQGSPLEYYYPENFESDLNGKLQEWEAVVLIPFIDEKILLEAMEPLMAMLTNEERCRNRHGPHNVFCFHDHGDLQTYKPSNVKVVEYGKFLTWELPADYFPLKVEELYKGLCKGVNLRSLTYGFPTLRHVRHEGSLKNLGVMVFNRSSSNPSMVLTLTSQEIGTVKDVSRDLIGRVVFVNWPHLMEALVVSVSSDELKFKSDSNLYHEVDSVSLISKELEIEEEALWHKEADVLKDRYHTRLGIEVGGTELLLGARRLIGKKFIVKSSGEVALEKYWSSTVELFLYQTSVKYSEVKNPNDGEQHRLEDFFLKGSRIFMLSNPHYGCEGKVLDLLMSDQPRIFAKFIVPKEPNLAELKSRVEEFEGSFMPAYLLAQRLAISSHLVSRITGTVFLVKENKSRRLNIGLNLKYNRLDKEVPGYTKKVGKDWLYSERVLELIREYIERFPELFKGIASMTNNDVFFAQDIFKSDVSEKFDRLEAFLKMLPTKSLEPRPHGTILLDTEVIKMIENEVMTAAKNPKNIATKMKVKPHLLWVPRIIHSPCAPDERAVYELFDRVINVRLGFTVPLGLRGTVIGIEPGENGQDYMYDVLFDKEFEGAMPLRCSSNKCYRVPGISLINLSYGERLATKSNRANRNINHGEIHPRMNGFTTEADQHHRLTNYREPVSMPRVNPNNRLHQSAAMHGQEAPQFHIMTNPGRNSENKERINDMHVNGGNLKERSSKKDEKLMENIKNTNKSDSKDIEYEEAWNLLKDISVNKSKTHVKDNVHNTNKAWNNHKNKKQVVPVAPTLKPPQAWIDKSSKELNVPQLAVSSPSSQAPAQMGKKISLEELLRGIEASMKISINNHVPSVPGNHQAPVQMHQQQSRQLQQQVQNHNFGQHLQQYRSQGHQQPPNGHQSQLQPQPFTPRVPGNGLGMQSLMAFCHSNGIIYPRCESRFINEGHQGRIIFKNGGWFVGPICKEESHAMEEAARLTLMNLTRQIQQFNQPPQLNGHPSGTSSMIGHGLHQKVESKISPIKPLPQPTLNPVAMAMPGLNPKANVFIPTQVMLKQKSSKGITPQFNVQSQDPVQERVAPPEDEKSPEQSMETSKPVEKKVTSRKRHRKRIAASFASPITD